VLRPRIVAVCDLLYKSSCAVSQNSFHGICLRQTPSHKVGQTANVSPSHQSLAEQYIPPFETSMIVSVILFVQSWQNFNIPGSFINGFPWISSHSSAVYSIWFPDGSSKISFRLCKAGAEVQPFSVSWNHDRSKWRLCLDESSNELRACRSA
jgi:hypothetical protein